MTIYVLCFVILSKTKVIDIKRQKNENKQTNKQTNICTAHFDDFFKIKIHIHMEESIATEINEI